MSKKDDYEDILRTQAKTLTPQEVLKNGRAANKVIRATRNALDYLGERPTASNIAAFLFGIAVGRMFSTGYALDDVLDLVRAQHAAHDDQQEAALGAALYHATKNQQEN